MKLSVKTMRDAGLEAKWGKFRGTPFIFVRNPNSKLKHQREQWWILDKDMWQAMNKQGIVEAFTNHTLLGDIFSIPLNGP